MTVINYSASLVLLGINGSDLILTECPALGNL